MENQSELRENILRKLSEIQIPKNCNLLYSSESPPGQPVHGISRWNLLLRGTLKFRVYENGKFFSRELHAPAIYYCTAAGYQWLTTEQERQVLSFCYYGSFIRVVWVDLPQGIFYYHSATALSPGGGVYIAALEALFAEKRNPDLLNALLNGLFLLTWEQLRADPGTGHAQINTRWTYINEFLRAHRAEKLSRGEIASIFHLSPGSLSRLSKANTGIEFAVLRLRYRLELAAELLCSTELPLKQIAAECGFDYTSYFYRCFGERYGLTPAEYRKQRRSGRLPSEK